MKKLIFKYGSMNSSKTAQALMTRYNYEAKGSRVWLIKSSADTRDGTDILRSRIGLQASAFVVTPGMNVKDIYDLPAWLKAGIDEGKTVLSCGFEDDVEDEAAAEYMLSRLSEAVMWSDNAGDLYMDYLWTQDDDGEYVLCIYLEYYGENSGYDVTDSEQEKIDEAVEEVFGEMDDWKDEERYADDVWKTEEEVSSILAAALDIM